MKYIPNILTCLRLVLTFIFIHYLKQEGLGAAVLATVIFTVASITDFLDGYLARKHDLTSDFGKIMDPIADKFLVLAAFYIFFKMGFVPLWMLVVIFLREVLVTVSRLKAVRTGRVIAAEQAGKLKTVMQIVSIFTILFFIVFRETRYFTDAPELLVYGWSYFILATVATAAVLTLISGISYFKNNWKVSHG